MVAEPYFATVAFPWILISPSNVLIDEGNGLFFPRPERTEKQDCRNFYFAAPVGWSKCPAGYAVLVLKLPNLFNYRLVLYGLRVKGVATYQGKSDVLAVITEKEVVQRYVGNLLQAFVRIDDFYQVILRRSVHEVRSINTDIKSAMNAIFPALENPVLNSGLIEERVRNTLALTEILSARTDFLEIYSNPEFSMQEQRDIRVYQKFHKAVRGLSNRAREARVRIHIMGVSHGRISGVRIFDVIPYLVIENAVKYSPADHDVYVDVEEVAEFIKVKIRNWGPKLDSEELNKIFQPGVRGAAAARLGVAGSGTGLFFVKELVELLHGGTIELGQIGHEKLIGGSAYRLTEVRMSFKRTK